MTLEEFIAQLHRLAFWKEFTFAKNQFTPSAGTELELADNLVWLDNFAFVLQLKQRENETEDPEAERRWFRRKVIQKGTSQVRDTLRFLSEHEQIRIKNERGHFFDVNGSTLTDITKIVVYLSGRELPSDCLQTQYHVSQTAGLIHILAAHDYLGVLEKLRVPEDIRRYFAYRARVLPQLREAGVAVEEFDIMGAFLGDELLPSTSSRDVLTRFVQDIDAFDLSRLLGDLHDHIERSDQPYDYYRIMLEFARIPRAMWREIKTRFMISLDTVRAAEFTRAKSDHVASYPACAK